MKFLGLRRCQFLGFVFAIAALMPSTASADVGGLDFYTLTTIPPCRVLDTRQSQLGPLVANTPRTVTIVGETCGVPEGAAAVALNVTVLVPTTDGYVTLYPTGVVVDDDIPPPAGFDPAAIAAVAYQVDRYRAKQLIVGLGTTGDLVAANIANTGQVELVIDVSGYFLNIPATLVAGGVLSYTENDPPTAIDTAITVTDPDDTGMQSATVQITGNYQNGADVLSFVNTVNISGVFSAATGTLTLTGVDTLANWQTALRNVLYENTSEDPSALTRTVTWIGSNGVVASTPVTSTINFTAVNDAPVLTAGGGPAPTFTEGGAPVTVDGGITVSDVDDVNIESAAVTIADVPDGASEILAATACAGLTVTPSLNALAITGSQPKATYQACLRSVTYENTSANPDTTQRSIEFTVNDGDVASNTLSRPVNMAAVNGAPVVTTTGGTTSFTEDGGPVLVDSGVTVTDADSANLVSAMVTITNPLDAPSEALSATACAGLTVTPGANNLSITGSQPPATYQTCLQSVTYNNSSQNPNTTARVISFVANDGTSSSATVTKTVTATAAADAPVVTTTGGTTPFTEDGGPVVVDSGLTVTDPDSANLASATVTITNPQNGASEVLAASACAGLTVTPGLNTLSITGSQPPATYQTCLQSVTYDNSSQNPGTTARIVSFVANDGGLGSIAATKTVSSGENADAPVVTTTGGATAFTEDGGPVVVDAGVTVTDIDSANLASATVTITNPLDAPFEVLAASACAGLTVTPVPNALNITGSQPLATYETCLQSVTYNNTSQNPSATARVLSFVASDGTAPSTPATRTVTVAPVDDSPTAVADSATVSEDSGANAINVLANDTDPDGGAISISAVTQPANGAVVITGGGTGLTYAPNANYCNTPPGTTLSTFTYTLTPGGSSTTVTVSVTCVDDSPTAVADAATVAEDSGANAVNVLTNDTDLDGGPISISAVTQPANGTVVITGGGTGLTYAPNANYCNTPPGTTLDTFTYTLTPGGSSTTVTMSVTCVDDSPTAVADAATVTEDSGANAINVLANDTDPDGGAISISSVTQPANGAVVITGGGTGLTYAPNANYCNTPPGTTLSTFTYTLTPGGSSTTVTVSVTCVDDNPTAVADSATVVEDSGANAINVLANDTDPDGGPISISSVTQPANGAVVITGGGTGLTYAPNADYCNTPPGTTLSTFTYTLTPGGSSTTVTVTVTCVDDPPTAVADSATVIEDSGANAINVLANDTDPDGGAISISSVTQPANGTVVITGGGTGLTYAPNLNYCNTPPGTTLSTFTYTLTPGGSSTTVTVSVTCVNDPPVPTTNPVTYATAGNTQLHVEGKVRPGAASILDAQGIDAKAGPFLDPDGPAAATLVDASGSSVNGGLYDVDPDGSFTYVPPVGFNGTDSFTYQVTDSVGTSSGTVNIAVSSRVWYIRDVVDANNAAGGDGRSSDAFDSITAFNAATTNDNDIIFVFRGNTGTTPHSGGITLRNGQKLHGEGIGLTVPSFGTVIAAGVRPRISNTGGDAVSVPATAGPRQNVEIRGLDLQGSVNAVDVTATGANLVGVTISDNTVSAAGAEGLDLNAGSTGAFTATVDNNNLAATGNAFDARTSVNTAMTLSITNNAVVSNATGILVDGSVGGGTTTITGFANNGVSGNNGGTGIAITSARFDSTPGGPFQTVSGGILIVGASGNGVGTSGVVMTNVAGDLSFTDMDIFADGGAGLRMSGTTPYTGSAGFQAAVGAGVATVTANGGPALDLSTVTASLPFQTLTSTNSPTTGVALNSLLGTVTAGSGSSISGITSAAGTAFQVGSSNATVTYNGTINTTTGKGVDLTSNAGSTIAFTGLLTLGSGTNTAFNVTGGVASVTATDAASTLTSTTGTALNVANSTIGAAGLRFRSISANGAASGIVLNNTGVAGSVAVSGTGSAGSGGTIQNTTSHGVSLTSTLSPSFSWMTIQNTAASGVKGTLVNNFTFTNGTVNNSGTALGAGESNIAFNTAVAGTENNLSGTVTITGNTLSNAYYHGVDILNYNGTLADANISNNTLTSSTVGASSQGSAIRLIAFGSASTAASVTRATISSNIISNFPTGDGIQVQSGNASAGPATTMGTAGSGTNIITVSGNRIAGQSAANKLGGNAIVAALRGSGQGNFDLSGNGTVGTPITNVAGIGIATSVFGPMNVTTTMSNNVIVANNTFGSQGILAGIDNHFGLTDAGTLTATIIGNTVSGTDGNGIYALSRNSAATLRAKIQNNTVAAPLGGVRPGIRIDSGSASGNTVVCLNISGNTSAGSGGTQGLGLRKQGTVAATNAFGVNGMAATSSPGVESFVDGLNPAGGGTLLISGTSGFTNCSFP